MRTVACMVVAAAALFLPAVAAQAAPISFCATKGDLSATVTFQITGTDLLVHLENTSTADVTDVSQIITGLFFHLTGTPALTRVSVNVGQGGAHGELVFDDEDAGVHGAASGGGSLTGSLITKRLPSPSRLSTRTCPPWASTMCLTRLSPMPTPVVSRRSSEPHR